LEIRVRADQGNRPEACDVTMRLASGVICPCLADTKVSVMRDNEGRLHALARRGGQMCECVRTNRCMTIACPTVGYAVVVASPTATGAKPLALNSVRGMPLHVRGMLTHAQVISDLRPFSV